MMLISERWYIKLQYVEMDIETAYKLCKGKGTVLVATKDLEKEDEVINFVKKTKSECEGVIRNAATIIQGCDDFMKQLNVFSYKQPDIMNIIPVGKMRVILFSQEE